MKVARIIVRTGIVKFRIFPIVMFPIVEKTAVLANRHGAHLNPKSTTFLPFGTLWKFGLLPGRCLLCGLPSQRAMDLCEPCEYALPWNLNACPLCALPQASPVARRCVECQMNAPFPDGVCSPFLYEDDIAKLLSRAKFRAGFASLALVSELCAMQFGAQQPKPDLLIPVPLSWRRMAKRGYNQSALIARYVSKSLGIPVDLRTLKRKRHTRPQSELSRSARLKNLSGAFTVRRDLSGKSVALIDDVLTTGATVRAASNTLKKAGAERVTIWVCARTPSNEGL